MRARMSIQTSLSGLKAWQLRHAAFLMGLPTTGNKAILETAIQYKLEHPQQPLEGSRILSVDMGIRNLAYCVVDLPEHTLPETNDSTPPSTSAALRISEWRKQDLLSTQLPTRTHPSTANTKHIPNPDPPTNPFTPSTLSRTAYTLATTFLSYNPHTILLERQRFRTGGGAAIQEWTVRVNMLESMLHACLYTLRQAAPVRNIPDVLEVSPARVANFWVAAAASDVALTPSSLFEARASTSSADVVAATRKKVQKKDKISIVRKWMTGSVNQDVRLQFEDGASRIRDMFLLPSPTRGKTTVGAREVQKVDDLADCLLQAAAWVRWEENSRVIRKMLAERQRG